MASGWSICEDTQQPLPGIIFHFSNIIHFPLCLSLILIGLITLSPPLSSLFPSSVARMNDYITILSPPLPSSSPRPWPDRANTLPYYQHPSPPSPLLSGPIWRVRVRPQRSPYRGLCACGGSGVLPLLRPPARARAACVCRGALRRPCAIYRVRFQQRHRATRPP